MALGLGTLLYVALLLVNAMAVLSEDRFLARSSSSLPTISPLTNRTISPVGWVSTQPQSTNTGFNSAYEQPGYGGGQGQLGIKAGVINLLSAVRTVMRSE